MKTSKILQMIDPENNNISPEISLDSVYYEVRQSDLADSSNPYLRKPVWPEIVMCDKGGPSFADSGKAFSSIDLHQEDRGDISVWVASVTEVEIDSSVASVNFVASEVNKLKVSANAAIQNVSNNVYNVSANVSTLKKSLNNVFSPSGYPRNGVSLFSDASLSYPLIKHIDADRDIPAAVSEGQVTVFLTSTLSSAGNIVNSSWISAADIRNMMGAADASVSNYNFSLLCDIAEAAEEDASMAYEKAWEAETLAADLSAAVNARWPGAISDKTDTALHVLTYSYYNGVFTPSWGNYVTGSGSTAYDDNDVRNLISIANSSISVINASINAMTYPFVSVSKTAATVKLGAGVTSAALNSLEINTGSTQTANSLKFKAAGNDISVNGVSGKSCISQQQASVTVKVSSDATPDGNYSDTDSNVLTVTPSQTIVSKSLKVGGNSSQPSVSISSGNISFFAAGSSYSYYTLNPASGMDAYESKTIVTQWIKTSALISVSGNVQTVAAGSLFTAGNIITNITGVTSSYTDNIHGNLAAIDGDAANYFMQDCFWRIPMEGFTHAGQAPVSLYAYRAAKLPGEAVSDQKSGKMFTDINLTSAADGWYIYAKPFIDVYSYNTVSSQACRRPADCSFSNSDKNLVFYGNYIGPAKAGEDIITCIYAYYFTEGAITGGPYRIWARWGAGHNTERKVSGSYGVKFGPATPDSNIINRNLFIGSVNDLFTKTFNF